MLTNWHIVLYTFINLESNIKIYHDLFFRILQVCSTRTNTAGHLNQNSPRGGTIHPNGASLRSAPFWMNGPAPRTILHSYSTVQYCTSTVLYSTRSDTALNSFTRGQRPLTCLVKLSLSLSWLALPSRCTRVPCMPTVQYGTSTYAWTAWYCSAIP